MQSEMLEIAKALVLQCGMYLKEDHELSIEEKEGIADLVTNQDRKIEAYLIERLSQHYPTHRFLSEESRVEDGEDLWIIDPIDGTTNYITSHRDFAISLAYYHHHKPVFGIVYDVMREELFVGINGEGAYLNGEKLAKRKPCVLSDCVIDASLHTMSSIKTSFSYDCCNLQSKLRGHRSFGCASLNIVHIAQGILDAYLSCQVKCWDYAAAMIILQEVGAVAYIQGDFFTARSTFALFASDEALKTTLWKELNKSNDDL